MRRSADDDEDDDEPDDVEDRDAPLPADRSLGDEEDDDLDPMPCPYCGARISERHEVCPRCRSFVLRDATPSSRRPAWVIVTVILLIVSLLLGIVPLW